MSDEVKSPGWSAGWLSGTNFTNYTNVHIFSGASLTSAAKKPFPNSFLKNALGTQDFSNEKDVGTSAGPVAPQR